MFDSPAPMPGVYGTTVTLITGLAWPLVAGTVTMVFRAELRGLLHVLTTRLSSAQTFKVGPLEISGIFEAAEERTRASLQHTPVQHEIPAAQVELSEKLEEQLDATGVSPDERLPIARARLVQLARDYDRLRDEAPSSEYRTRRLDEIVAVMRTFALPAVPLLPELSASFSPGERMAAIAILQVRSLASYLPWVRNRFAEENQAFLLYHSALVLRRMARLPGFATHAALQEAVSFGLQQVRGFTGTPDANTLDVLEDAQAFLES